jgi:hypothetical protein
MTDKDINKLTSFQLSIHLSEKDNEDILAVQNLQQRPA